MYSDQILLTKVGEKQHSTMALLVTHQISTAYAAENRCARWRITYAKGHHGAPIFYFFLIKIDQNMKKNGKILFQRHLKLFSKVLVAMIFGSEQQSEK